MKNIFVLSVLLYLSNNLIAQDFKEEFDKFKQNNNQDYKDYNNNNNKTFYTFNNKNDSVFYTYLKQNWESVNVLKGIKRDTAKKPVVLPKYVKTEEPINEIHVPIDIIKNRNNDEIEIVIPSEEVKINKTVNTQFAFYGNDISIDVDSSIFKLNAISKSEEIADIYVELSSLAFELTITQLQKYSNDLALNDFGYYQLIKTFVNTLNVTDKNKQVIQWFYLLKSGYQVKLAFSNNGFILLCPVIQPIYQTTYVVINNIRYYLFEYGDIDKILTCIENYPLANKQFDLSFDKTLLFKEKILKRNISVKYLDKPYQFSFSYNKNIVDFYNNYFDCDFTVYFNNGLSQTAKTSIENQLEPVLKNFSKKEGISFLLNLVQNGFAYKIDDEQFGKENYLFPEEVLFYPYSDCEDRSFFFASLVKLFYKVDVIGLEFPNHITTAVNFTSNVAGTFINYDNKKFVICDPSFINAPIGAMMPSLKYSDIKVIPNSNKEIKNNIENKVWEKLGNIGCIKTTKNNIVLLDDGSIYVTGVFKDTIHVNGNTIVSGNSSADVFIAKYSNDYTLQWFKQIKGNSNEDVVNIALDKDENIFITGWFDASISIELYNLKPIKRDLFLLKLNKDGRVALLDEIKLDLQNKNRDYYVLQYDMNSKETTVFDSDFMVDEQIGKFVIDENNICYLSGYVNYTKGIINDGVVVNTMENYDLSSILINENNKLVSSNYDKTVAGLFAVINIMGVNGSSMTGDAVAQAISKTNPSFKTKNPNIYTAISQILSIPNVNGIITISTKNGSNVSISNMKIKNGATMKVIQFTNGTARIDFISGVQVGKSVIWYDLNFIKLNKNNSQLVFDYDDDHTQKPMSLRPDIID